MATPKKTKTPKEVIPDFPQTIYASENQFDREYFQYGSEVEDVLTCDQKYVAVYVLDQVKRVNRVPEQITLENL